tara:strand:- start:464 stop:1096 length:633 start_codon:yes stop_codon:yes gene_type:complete
MDIEVLKNLKIDIENYYFRLNVEKEKEHEEEKQLSENNIQNTEEDNTTKTNEQLLYKCKDKIVNFTNTCSITKFIKFKDEMIIKYNKQIDTDIINYLCTINKYEISQEDVYNMIINLKQEINKFYKNLYSMNTINKEIYLNDQKKEWLVLYGDLYMRSDTLYNGLVNQTLDYTILEQILNNMKQVNEGNKTKMNSDIEIGKILFNKYVSK